MSDEALTISVPIASNATVGGSNNGSLYRGFSLREVSGTGAAVIRIRDGSATGTILDTVSLVANESSSDHYGTSPLWANGKIYVQLVSGTLPEGSIRIG